MQSRVQTQNVKGRPRSTPFWWLIPTQLVAVFAAVSAAAGENLLRFSLLGGMFSALLLPLLISLEAGLMAMIVFEPFRGFLRRAQYILVPYSDAEPIHLLTPIVTLIALVIVLFRNKLETIRLTPLAGWTTALAALCFIQIFNPLQGSLFVGFSGALFYLVPMAWFYFGQTVKEEFVPKVLRLIVILGLIASLHGLYQLVFGYPYFEKYWIDNTDQYSSIAVFNVQRALATFSNSEEWGRYIQIGCTIAIGLGLSRREGYKRIFWFGAACSLFVMIAFTGQRTSIFGLMLAGGILILTGAKSIPGLMARLGLMLAPIMLVAVFSNPLNEDAGYSLDESDRVGAMLTHTTKGTINPAGEGSLEARFETWSQLITNDIPANPLGLGLGATTLAGNREEFADAPPIDNHFLSLAMSSGFPAALLLAFILIRACMFCYQGWRRTEADSEESMQWRIALALMATFILNNFFGTSFIIYSVAPIGWLLIGWVSLNYAKLEQSLEETETMNGSQRGNPRDDLDWQER